MWKQMVWLSKHLLRRWHDVGFVGGEGGQALAQLDGVADDEGFGCCGFG